MLKTKRKRAVVLALIAFFCTAATTYVAVDWKRFGGGFLAFLRGRGDQAVASRPNGGAGDTGRTHVASADGTHDSGGSLPMLAPARSRRHTAEVSSGAGGGHKSDEDLFKYGDPAAGGIPPGSFIVADNAGGGAGAGGGDGPSVPQVTTPAPQPAVEPEGGAPGPSNGGLSDNGLTGKNTTPASSPTPTPPSSPTPPSPPVSGPPSSPPPSDTPPPPPDQSGTTDPGAPVPPSSPVSAVPEASTTSMMALGALFLAVAATRQRKKA